MPDADSAVVDVAGLELDGEPVYRKREESLDAAYQEANLLDTK